MLKSAAGDTLSVDSAGVYEGAPDPFLPSILAEIGIELNLGAPKEIADLGPMAFDLVIALTPEAAKSAEQIAPPLQVEFWPTPNPSQTYGSREQILEAYREVRKDLEARLRERFPQVFQAA